MDMLLDALLLQAAKEGFRHSIVPAVASPTHARFKSMGLAESAPGIAAILRPLI
jgi:hypothetical protein